MKPSRLGAGRVPVTNPLLIDGEVRWGRVVALLVAVVLLGLFVAVPLLFTAIAGRVP